MTADTGRPAVPPAGPCHPDGTGPATAAAFEDFFLRHHRDLGRLAYLLTGDAAAADDVIGDVFLAVWRQWDQVRSRDEPVAYVRRMVVNTAADRIRRLVRERRRDGLLHTRAPHTVPPADGALTVDVRTALLRLSPRRRSCVALRYALDLGEREVADLLGISVGTVKAQTAKGVAQLRELLGELPADYADPARARAADRGGPAGRGGSAARATAGRTA